MRIRKRQPPFPLSDPLSDTSMVVQVHNSSSNHPHPHHCLPQLPDSSNPHPSDHPNRPIRTANNGFGSSDNDEKKDCLVLLQKEHDKGVEEKKSNDSRKKTMVGAQFVATAVAYSHESSSSHQAGGRWCEGEKAFPLKKRRGSFERSKANEEMTIVEKDNKKMKTKMKTKMNKKFAVKDDGNEQQQGGGERKESGGSENSSGKKRGRGGALMEGSRCSRVNGRGWRCCQQTLVGYSLCEHHLGKGRLRSMTSVRSRALGTSAASPAPHKNHDSTASSTHSPLSTTSFSTQESHETKLEDDHQDEDDEKPLMITAAKKRMKLGMVKARSMSSLLGQTNTEITVADK